MSDVKQSENLESPQISGAETSGSSENTEHATPETAQADLDAAAPDANAEGLAEIYAGLLERGLVEAGVEVKISTAAIEAIDALIVARDAAVAEVAELKSKLEQAAAAPKAKSGAAVKGRKCGPIKYRDGEFAPPSAELLELIECADEVEVVFSDGKTEIVGLAPLVVQGKAWSVTPSGLQLTVGEVLREGPAGGAAPYRLAGFGLFLEGKQVAYSPRIDVFEIVSGSKVNLGPDICFRG